MATGAEFVTEALEELGIRAAETPIEAADMLLGIKKLNDMMAEWDESGTPLGFTPLGDETDTVRLRRGAYSAVKYNLAGRLSVPFQKPISPELAAEIKAANKALLRMTVRIGDVKQPATLPVGTGNNQDSYLYDEKFFQEQSKDNW